VTECRKLLAGALTASICLFGVTATADAAGKAKRPAHQQASRTEWDRKPTDHPKLDRKLNDRSDRGGSGTSSMIVTFQPGMEAGNQITKLGGKRVRRFNLINSEEVELPNNAIRELADNSAIKDLHWNRPTKDTNYRTSVTVGARAVREQYGYDGAGVGVAVIDSGITAWHDDLTYQGSNPKVKVVAGQRVLKFVDFVNSRTTPYDDNGHGSHVAGIILGNGYDTQGGLAGIAPAADLVSLKVLDDHGAGYISNLIAAFDWAVTNKAAYNIRVINVSVGAAVTESYMTDPLTLAAKRCVDAGIVVVIAAGNLGKNAVTGKVQYGGITAPANAPWVLTVGAYSHQGTVTRVDDIMGSYSSHGPTAIDYDAKPDVVAPGTGTVSLADYDSTYYTTKAAYLLNGSIKTPHKPYLSLTGTSQAAPVVAGTVALMMQANRNLTPNLVKAIIEYTAQKYNYDALTQGAGFLNAKGAVDLAKFLAAPHAGQHYPHNKAWSRTILWGNHRLNHGVIKPAGSAYARNTVWGASTDGEGDNIVWGTVCGRDAECDNIVWGTSSLDAANIGLGTVETEGDNIVWGTADGETDNIVWGTACGATECDNIVWGTECGLADCDNIVWGTALLEADNIVWGTAAALEADNIVWGTSGEVDNIVWGTASEVDNIVWGTASEETTLFDDPDVPSVFAAVAFDSLFGKPAPAPVTHPPVAPPPATLPEPPAVTVPTVPVVGGF
jgi:serine protease AprX